MDSPVSPSLPFRTGTQDRSGHRHSGLLLALALLAGCTPPVLRQAAPAELQADRLAFLLDGSTTREEVLLRLGTPSAHFEGERILTYAFSRWPSGSWARTGRNWSQEEQRPVYLGRGSGNLVLVFDEAGRLVRHGLVVSE